MKSVSNTILSLGLVQAPVQMYSAVEQGDINFNMSDPDGKPLSRVYVDDRGRQYTSDQCERSYDGLLISKADIERIKNESSDNLTNLTIEEFVPFRSIPFQRVYSWYYIASNPNGGDVNAFAAIAYAMKRRRVAGICKTVIKGRQRAVAIYIDDDGVMNAVCIAFANSVREYTGGMTSHVDVKIRPNVKRMATNLIDAYTNKESSTIDQYVDSLLPLKLELIERAKKQPDKPIKAESQGVLDAITESLRLAKSGTSS